MVAPISGALAIQSVTGWARKVTAVPVIATSATARTPAVSQGEAR
jgi:hypothetical protein